MLHSWLRIISHYSKILMQSLKTYFLTSTGLMSSIPFEPINILQKRDPIKGSMTVIPLFSILLSPQRLGLELKEDLSIFHDCDYPTSISCRC